MQDKLKDANTTWHTIQNTLSKLITTNMIVTDGPGNMATAMEGAGGIGIVNELLIQSQDPRGIVLFPQIPQGEPASFKQLRARGGFLVSASLSETGQVHDLVLTNDRKDRSASNVTMLSPWWPSEAHVQVVELNRGPQDVSMQDGWFTFYSSPGETFNISATAIV